MTGFEDELARMRADADQNRESLKGIAEVLVAFYRALAEGMSDDHALELTRTMLEGQLRTVAQESATEAMLEQIRKMGEGES